MDRIYFVWAVPASLVVDIKGKEKEKVLNVIKTAVSKATKRLSAAAYVESWDDEGEIISVDEYPVVEPNRLNYSPNLANAVSKIRSDLKKNFPSLKVRMDLDLTPYHVALFRYEDK